MNRKANHGLIYNYFSNSMQKDENDDDDDDDDNDD